MPGMCLMVVAVALMLVVGWGSATTTVEEAATAAAQEVANEPEIAPRNLETQIYKSMGKQALS